MATNVITAADSIQKQARYEPNRRIYSITSGSIPGLQEEITLLPTSIIGALKEMFGETAGGELWIGGEVDTYSTTQIETKPAWILTDDACYYIEPLTFTPDATSWWGFLEYKLEAVDTGDPIVADFWDSGTKTAYTDTSDTTRQYVVTIQENFNTSAAYPSVSSGFTKWISYQRVTAGGNITSVSSDRRPALHVRADGDVVVTADPIADDAVTRKSYVTALAGVVPGQIIGGLLKDSNNPPTILSGSYEINGVRCILTANESVSITNDRYGPASHANNNWHGIFRNSSGTRKWHLLSGTLILGSLTISGITNPVGSTYRYSFSGSPSLSGIAVGDHFHATGCTNSNNDGKFPITAVNDGSDYIEVTNSNGATQGGAAGTGAAYYPVGNVPGGGTTVERYSPAPTFSSSLGGYYSQFLSGSYRLLGAYYVDNSGVVTHILSYGSGRWKGDDQIRLLTSSARGSTNTQVRRWNTVSRAWGTSMTLTQSSTLGDYVTINEPGFYAAQTGCFLEGTSVYWYYITIDATSAGSSADHNNPAALAGSASPVGFSNNSMMASGVAYLTAGQVVRVVSNPVDGAGNSIKSQFLISRVA